MCFICGDDRCRTMNIDGVISLTDGETHSLSARLNLKRGYMIYILLKSGYPSSHLNKEAL